MTSVIVVGSGHWGQNLVRNFYELGHLAGVVEVDAVLRARITAQYPDLPVFTNLSDALNTTVPAIVLATPAPTHFDLAMTVLKAGKDIFVEKPMTLHAHQARQLVEHAEAHDRILMVGHLLLYQPAIAWMREYLKSGKAGDVNHVATHRLNLGKVRTTENVWWSLAPHDISIILDLLGNPALSNIQATGYARLQPNIEDEVHASLQFVTGQTAHLHCSWQWPLKQRGTVVLAERQMIVYDEIQQTITLYDKHIDKNLDAVDNGNQPIHIADAQPLKLECQHFLDCVATRKRPYSDGWNGLAVVEILERVEEALHA